MRLTVLCNSLVFVFSVFCSCSESPTSCLVPEDAVLSSGEYHEVHLDRGDSTFPATAGRDNSFRAEVDSTSEFLRLFYYRDGKWVMEVWSVTETPETLLTSGGFQED